MSSEENRIKDHKEINLIIKENINQNNNSKSQENVIPTINMNKEQLFQSFLLFQDFISKNPNILGENKIINIIKKEENEVTKDIFSQNNDDENNNKFLEEEKTNREQTLSDINNNSTIKLYDDIPIKSTGYNFVELLEKSLAKEEKINQIDKNKNNLNTKIIKKTNDDNLNEKENLKSTNEQTDKNKNIVNNEKEKNVIGFIDEEINDIKINDDIKNEPKLESKNKEKADIIKKEINQINIIKNNENINNKDEQIKQDDKLNNGKEISNLNDENNKKELNEIKFSQLKEAKIEIYKMELNENKCNKIKEEKNEIYKTESNELENEINNDDKKIIITNNNLNNNQDKKNNDLTIKDNFQKDKLFPEKNLLIENVENGSALNKEKLIKKKIKELNII